MKQGDNKFIFLMVFILLGTVMAMQVRGTLNANKQKSAVSYTVDKLKMQLEEQKKANSQLSDRVGKNEKRIEEFLKSTIENKNDQALRQGYNNLEDLRLKAGLTDVKGKGIVIKLDDAPFKYNEDIAELILHDSDLITVINELKKAGAQAIAINNERITALSEQVCMGPTILVNMNKYTVPFEIRAIGDPDTLYSSLDGCEYIAMMRASKIRVEISKSENITIPKYNLGKN